MGLSKDQRAYLETVRRFTSDWLRIMTAGTEPFNADEITRDAGIQGVAQARDMYRRLGYVVPPHDPCYDAVEMLSTSMENAPHVVLPVRIYRDGNQWCCLYGLDIQEGVAGFGDSPAKAAAEFDKAWAAAMSVDRQTPKSSVDTNPPASSEATA